MGGFATDFASASNTRSTTLFERTVGRSLGTDNVALPDSRIINNRSFDNVDDAFGSEIVGSHDGYTDKFGGDDIENETLDWIAEEYVLQLAST